MTRYRLRPKVSLASLPDRGAVLVDEASGRLYALNPAARAIVDALQRGDGDVDRVAEIIDPADTAEIIAWTRSIIRQLARRRLIVTEVRP